MQHEAFPAVSNSRESTARILAAAISLAAFGATIILLFTGDGSPLENAAWLASFFTIWSNIAASLIFGWIALGRHVPRSIMAALATALTVVGGIYWSLLAGDHHPVGIERVTNQIHHTIVPIGSVLWWLRYTPLAERILPLIPVIMVPPLSYGAFAFVLGEITGFYAYFFVDLPALGWPMFLLNNAGLALFFAALGAGLVKLKNAFGPRDAVKSSLPLSEH